MKQVMALFLVILSLNSFSQDTTNLDMVPVFSIRASAKIPATYKTIQGDELRKLYQGQEIPILLNTTPSIVTSTDGGHPQGYTYYRLRGMDQTRINMTLNGVILNEPEDQGVYTSNYPMFATNLQSVQVQRGVGTSTNGVSSYAGSISFQSRTGLEQDTEIQVGYGSWNTKRFSISNSTGLSKKGFALFTSVAGYGTDGYRYHSGGKGSSAFVSGGYYGLKDIVRVTAFSGRSINQMAWLAVSEESINKNPRTNDNTNGEMDRFTQSFIQLQYIRTLNKESKVSVTGFYNRLDGNWDFNLNSIGAGSDVLNYQLGSNFYGGIANYNYNKKNLRVNVGISANTYKRNHAMSIYPDLKSNLYTNYGRKYEISQFIKVGLDAGKFSLFGDMQYRYVGFTYVGDVNLGKLNWSFFNPKGGVIFTQNKNINYYFSLGQTKREPTRTNLFGGDDNLVTFVDVKHEKVTDYELGVNVNTGNLNLQANLYYMNFKNEITPLGPLGANGLPLMINVPKSYRSGIEIDVTYKLDQLTTSTTNVSISRNRMEFNSEKFQQLYSPSVVINQSLGYKFGGFTTVVSGKYHSKSYINFENTAITPAFAILNLDVSYRYKAITLMLQGVNLTSKKYYTNGYTIGDTRYYFANAPISVYGTIKINL